MLLKRLELDYLASGRKLSLSEKQKIELEKNFQCRPTLHHTDRFALAYCLHLPDVAVHDWYKARKKELLEEMEPRKRPRKGEEKTEAKGD